MLSDPQTITVNAVAKVMPKVESDGTSSVYRLADQTFGLAIRHTNITKAKKARVKSLAAFSQRAIVPDPLTTVNDYEDVIVSVQVDRPLAGFTSAQIDYMVQGFKTWLDSTMVGKLFGGES